MRGCVQVGGVWLSRLGAWDELRCELSSLLLSGLLDLAKRIDDGSQLQAQPASGACHRPPASVEQRHAGHVKQALCLSLLLWSSPGAWIVRC